jgi:predicted MPP superfamily phosphohydrolase
MNKWSKEDIDRLKKMLSNRESNIYMAKNLGRTPDSISWKLKSLGVTRKNTISDQLQPTSSKHVSDEEIATPDYSKMIEILRQNIFKQSPLPTYSKNLHEEKVVLILSDMHTGMLNELYVPGKGKVITYDEQIRQAELVHLRDSVFKIHHLFKHAYNMSELNIMILGDMITNDRIFEGQVFEIDRPYGLQMWDTSRDLVHFISEMKSKFAKVNVFCVVGNHGRSSSEYKEEPVENNYEWTLYKIIEKSFEGDNRVQIVIPNTRFYSTKICGHTYYMHHGDNLRGGGSRNALEKAAKDILTTLIPDLPSGFDVYMCGHFHRSEKLDINEKSTVLINGCWIPRDAYGFRMFRQYSKPAQWLFGVNPKRPITWHFNLELNK